MADYYLYLLIRNDLPSLVGEKNGKAIAHGAHAANQFVYEAKNSGMSLPRGYYEWEEESPLGFGTTISLTVDIFQLQAAVTVARACGFAAGITVDDTYPYILHREYANLIKHPEDYPPTSIGKDGMMLCIRKETTAGYVFGLKSELRPILGNLSMVP